MFYMASASVLSGDVISASGLVLYEAQFLIRVFVETSHFFRISHFWIIFACTIIASRDALLVGGGSEVLLGY